MKKVLIFSLIFAVLFSINLEEPAHAQVEKVDLSPTEVLIKQLNDLQIQLLLAKIAELQAQINQIVSEKSTSSASMGATLLGSESVVEENRFSVRVIELNEDGSEMREVKDGNVQLGKIVKIQIQALDTKKSSHPVMVSTNYPKGFSAYTPGNTKIRSNVTSLSVGQVRFGSGSSLSVTRYDISVIANTAGTWDFELSLDGQATQTLRLNIQ